MMMMMMRIMFLPQLGRKRQLLKNVHDFLCCRKKAPCRVGEFEFGVLFRPLHLSTWILVGVVSDGARGAVWRAVALQVGGMNRHSCAGIYKFISERCYLKKTIQRIPSSHNFAHHLVWKPPLRHSWFLFESLGCSSKSSEPFAQAHLLGKPPRATRTRSSSAGPTQVDDFVWMKSQTSVQGIDGTGDDIAPELSIEFCVVFLARVVLQACFTLLQETALRSYGEPSRTA